jgi:hypothetical protein
VADASLVSITGAGLMLLKTDATVTSRIMAQEYHDGGNDGSLGSRQR